MTVMLDSKKLDIALLHLMTTSTTWEKRHDSKKEEKDFGEVIFFAEQVAVKQHTQSSTSEKPQSFKT